MNPFVKKTHIIEKNPAIWAVTGASARDFGSFDYYNSTEVGRPQRELRGLLKKFGGIRKSLEGFRGRVLGGAGR